MRTLLGSILLVAVSLSSYAATIPRPSPELAIRSVEGGQILLSQARGKVVLLTFLYTT